MPGDTADR